VGTLAWFVAAVVLLVSGGPAAWIAACVTGGLLGFLGLAMIHWQRRAAQRGARGAQQDLF
jgi:cell division protein FtsW (lipid II flippase)